MLRRALPHPLLTLILTIVWMMLVNKVTLGHLFLGVVLGVVIPGLTAPYWPNRPKLGRPLKMAEYATIVLWDIIRANVTVARIVLFKPVVDIHSQWVALPLDLTSPEAITALAGTITMTPGTVSATLSSDGGALLIHCLHNDDPDAVCREIKHRYERRLKEIFE
ncbi:cation:proton antiporter [Salipiger aestuarii]|uniref:Multicomponent K+:H+ antiporter subunit E n=1 Tax=Salipiger aestuarii TaxID=568098 RepID=A0A327XWC5_9RHOB|nr:Na+/H+ antiporter subunit E [Salipiger aestuarii]EIE52802.1 putative monovalent cation/H+ antiporter subunit E [Citreicella sp. 357]KAA8606221.1 cation:proton antiporter [Salipiger aestuarii]KAA8609161.1 cation:proton antiporter [Salipiger aestuarii]KAB2540886.1 cation:proton antiporter [Salipiger aestuarii]RAK12407.1 multicomponent K+:H+ antiporter subunit E [Salipiger aestuarii]